MSTDSTELVDDADPWPALLQLAELVNDLAGRIDDHEQRLGPEPPTVVTNSLEEWVGWLADEYGLHTVIGNRDRWATTPPVRNELAALRLASDVLATAKLGSFEPVYWHDALDRVIERISRHYDRWSKNQEALTLATRATHRASTKQTASE